MLIHTGFLLYVISALDINHLINTSICVYIAEDLPSQHSFSSHCLACITLCSLFSLTTWARTSDFTSSSAWAPSRYGGGGDKTHCVFLTIFGASRVSQSPVWCLRSALRSLSSRAEHFCWCPKSMPVAFLLLLLRTYF